MLIIILISLITIGVLFPIWCLITGITTFDVMLPGLICGIIVSFIIFITAHWCNNRKL